MGLVFDLLLLGYFAFAVFCGYRKGFLLSVSGILALVISFVIYKTVGFEYIYFALVYLALLIAIGFCAKLIRRLKIPILAKTDAILGAIIGGVNGIAGALVIAAAVLVITAAGGIDALDSSVALRFVQNVLPF